MTCGVEISKRFDKWIVEKDEVTIGKFFAENPDIQDTGDDRALIGKLLRHAGFWTAQRAPGSAKGPKLYVRKPGA